MTSVRWQRRWVTFWFVPYGADIRSRRRTVPPHSHDQSQGFAAECLGKGLRHGDDRRDEPHRERILSAGGRASSPARFARRYSTRSSGSDRVKTVDHVGRGIIARHGGVGVGAGLSRGRRRCVEEAAARERCLRRLSVVDCAGLGSRGRGDPPRERARAKNLRQGRDFGGQLRPARARLRLRPADVSGGFPSTGGAYLLYP